MMIRTALITTFLLGILIQANAQNSGIFPIGTKAANVHHVGDVYLSELVHADSVFNFSVSYVVSEAGSRLDWHTHPGGQILFILDGEGFYQEKGKPKQTVRKGDVIQCQPDVIHWHGATPESQVIYMATSPSGKGGTKWLDKLTEAEYLSKQ